MNEKKKTLQFDENKNLKIVEEDIKQHREEKNKSNSATALASELGFSISLPIVGGALLGQFLDNKLNSTPRMTLSLVFIGLFLGIVNIYLIIRDNSK